MARFLGTAAGRTSGAVVATGFTKAKVFAGAGATTFTVPTDVTKLKVFVVGAGSSYRGGTYAFCSSNCASGVDYPRSCYCACFTGHLTGAGGGYAEKTFTASDAMAGKTLTINVGSIGGLSASSVSAGGITTVTASNATEAVYSWSCTSNSTARDASNDNPISLGFRLPVCGYVNTFSGYYNKGGTASGGDVNRTGGSGVLIPEFLNDSYLDGITCCPTPSGTTGAYNGSSCWVNPIVTCANFNGYHSVFGGYYNYNFTANLCSCLCFISSLCHCTAAGSATPYSSRFSFAGKASKCSGTASCMFLGAELTGANAFTNCAANQFIKDAPSGVGAQSGNSSNNGKNGYSELTLVNTTFSNCCSAIGVAGTGSPITVSSYQTSSGYDFSFGGTGYTCYCNSYDPGCYSSGFCRGSGNPSAYCYQCIGYAFTYVFGSAQSNPICHCLPYGYASCCSLGGGGCCCINRCYNMGFINDSSLISPPTEYTIPLSTLTDENGNNIGDIVYGRGAGVGIAATYGGGGNRNNPVGGNGIVVITY